jgi:hypothetical protein
MKFKHGNVPDSKFDKVQLKMGIKVEMEHTYSRKIAKQIAKAHLMEHPKYYTYLKKMEARMKMHGDKRDRKGRVIQSNPYSSVRYGDG